MVITQTGGYVEYQTQAERDELCPTCVGRACAPFRQFDERGKVLNGCVDDFHTGHLTQISESNSWHNRPDAKKIRASIKKFLNAR